VRPAVEAEAAASLRLARYDVVWLH